MMACDWAGSLFPLLTANSVVPPRPMISMTLREAAQARALPPKVPPMTPPGTDSMATSQRLFIHRNTLRHRLSRIREITGCGMENAEERLNFSVAFKLQEYMEFLSVN